MEARADSKDGLERIGPSSAVAFEGRDSGKKGEGSRGG
jgi:hypothetical protein